jgi:hypothetical protein
MPDIFLSYAHADKEKAEILASLLAEDGYSIWWDRDVPYGKNFDREIEKHLNASICVIVLWSKNSLDSAWVRAEADLAVKNSTLFPLLVDNVDLPLQHRLTKAFNISNWDFRRESEEYIAIKRELERRERHSYESHVQSALNRLLGRINVADDLIWKIEAKTRNSDIACFEYICHEYARLGDLRALNIINSYSSEISTAYFKRHAMMLNAFCFLANKEYIKAQRTLYDCPPRKDFTMKQKINIALIEIFVCGTFGEIDCLDTAWADLSPEIDVNKNDADGYPFTKIQRKFDKALLSTIYGKDDISKIVENLPIKKYKGAAHFSAATSKAVRKSNYILHEIEKRGIASGWKKQKSVKDMWRRCREYELLVLPTAGSLVGPTKSE